MTAHPMNRSFRTVLAASALAALCAAGAAAQTIASPYRYIEKTRSVTVYAGYLATSPGVALPDSQSAELGPQSAPLVGLRYSMRIGGPLSLEANVGFAPADRKLYNGQPSLDSTRVPVEDTGETVSAPLLLTEGALRFHLTGDRTWRGLAPFVLASGGLVTDLGGTSEAEEEIPEQRRVGLGPGLALGAGAGVDVFHGQRLSLRAELAYRLWRQDAPGGLLPAGSEEVSEWNSSTGITLGAAYHF